MKAFITSNSKEETIELGKLISKFLFPTSVITLTGDLGAGKTTFTNGVAQGLGINERVNSPTFNIMKCYFHAKVPMFHIDAYRLKDGNKDIGLEEFIDSDGISLIEWPEFISELIDAQTKLEINLTHRGDNKRYIEISTKNIRYADLFKALEAK